jgi:enamine deaminase RidA (YjgF/YER057c/UK114 family)
MERKIINPWTWQERAGFVQGVETVGAARFFYCAGQTSMDGEGRPVHAGDLRAQIAQALDNLETVLDEAGYGLADVVRLNYYTTDVDRFIAEFGEAKERLAQAGCHPSSTLLGVTRLAYPELLIEIEATAAK